MDSTMWSKVKPDFQMLVGGVPGQRKLTFRVGDDLTLFMGKEELEEMVVRLAEGLSLVRQQIAKDEATVGQG
jgi:hypothetical protein